MGELAGLLLEHPDELRADGLALGLGVGHALQPLEEALLCVHGHERDLERVAERAHHLLALFLAHQAVVNEHTRELLAHRAMHEQRGHRGVNAAGQAADHAPLPHLLADAPDLLLHDRRRRPRPLAAAHVGQKAREDLLAVGGVDDLGMELDAVDAAGGVLDGGHRRGARGGQGAEAGGRLEHGVPV